MTTSSLVPVTVREAAQRLGVAESTIRRWMREGDLEGYRLSGLRTTEDALRRFVESRKLQPDAAHSR
jgi:excisionase family DNA binding protein